MAVLRLNLDSSTSIGSIGHSSDCATCLLQGRLGTVPGLGQRAVAFAAGNTGRTKRSIDSVKRVCKEVSKGCVEGANAVAGGSNVLPTRHGHQ